MLIKAIKTSKKGCVWLNETLMGLKKKLNNPF
jgi:hypothetical protein